LPCSYCYYQYYSHNPFAQKLISIEVVKDFEEKSG